MVVKSKTMAGFRAPYVPGWDCHGLPIETQVEKELGGKKGSVPPGEFRRMCREFATRYVDQHRRDFKRLGVLGQWEDPYLTMSPHYEATIADAFVTFLEKGHVYRGLKPVYWCIFDSTALAEAEVEYEDHTSPSIWVKFAVEPGAAAEKLGAGVSGVIWTTTPWTLPHNRALAFHPEYEYVVAETSAGALLLAADLVGPALDALKLEAISVRGPWKGKELADLKFKHPFLDLVVPAVLADYVTLDQGTGIVHTAPGHGVEDFPDRAEIWHRSIRADRWPWPLSGRLAGVQRQDRVRGEPHRCRALARSWRSARRTKTFAQLSALLALPQSCNFSRHRTMVHRFGRSRAGAGPIRLARLRKLPK